MRVIWTSFDYLSGPFCYPFQSKYYPDIVVGGIVDFRLYSYPEGPKA